MQRMGIATMSIHVCPKTTDISIPIVLPIRVDVVNSDVAMLVSHESTRRMQRSIGFSERAVSIPSAAAIKLSNAKSGHLAIQGRRPSEKVSWKLSLENHPLYVMEMELPSRLLSGDEIAKIHAQLGHCSENTSSSTIRAAQTHWDLSVIQKVLHRRKRQTAVRRIAPPSVS